MTSRVVVAFGVVSYLFKRIDLKEFGKSRLKQFRTSCITSWLAKQNKHDTQTPLKHNHKL